ncbi:MAG: acyl-CoA dehydrogenase family protein [Myxococcota bacterium]|jgi:alkylation response protein AidB-like acyl-CoA dehydrogenase
MHFDFDEDQRLLQQTVRDYLEGACPVERIRELWDTETGRSPLLWKELAGIGLPGLLVSEAHGGLGMNEIDWVLLQEEVGRAALAEPLVPCAVGAKLIAESGNTALADAWLPKVAAGEAQLAVGHPASPFVADAHVADLLLLSSGGEGDEAVHAVPAREVGLEAQPASDGSQRLFRVTWEPSEATLLARGDAARALLTSALDRGAFASAAQALGVADRLIELAVEYAGQRVQFGVPIGSFQAVKHMLADAKVKLEYARSHVYRAAYSVAEASDSRPLDVSMAKLAACEAAREASKTSLQVHGAIGYTYEQDVHVWMKRAASLELAWGDSVLHRERLERSVIDREPAAASFGYSFAGA